MKQSFKLLYAQTLLREVFNLKGLIFFGFVLFFSESLIFLKMLSFCEWGISIFVFLLAYLATGNWTDTIPKMS